MKLIITGILTLVIGAGSVSANPLLHHPHIPGFILLPEQRYDPAVQRYLAEQSLRALPLRDGQLYYVYPINTSSTYTEQMQIRYLEMLLSDKAEEEDEPQTD